MASCIIRLVSSLHCGIPVGVFVDGATERPSSETNCRQTTTAMLGALDVHSTVDNYTIISE
jgi:hypothetical protein